MSNTSKNLTPVTPKPFAAPDTRQGYFRRILGRSVFAVRRWLLGRQWRLLLPGLPALVVGVVAVGLVGFALAEGSRDVAGRYLEQATARFKVGDYAGAMTCYERLTSSGVDRPEVVFGLARSAEAVGLEERAIVLMRELAPHEGRGHGPAHLWWAKRLLSSGGPSPENMAKVERHLLHALDAGVENREAVHGLLGEVYLNRGQIDQAETHLHKAVDTNPQLNLRLAQLYFSRGDQQRGRKAAEQAARFFQEWTKAELYVRAGRMGLADARILLGDYPAAVAALQEGLNATGDVEYRRALSRVHLAWSRQVAEKKDSVGEQLALIEKALALDPDNPELVLRIWAMTRVKGKESDEAVAVLRKQLSSGKATALTHLALGMYAWEDGKQAEALLHLEQAYKLAPRMALVANNLAWVLANANPPDLKRALGLINTVIEQWPRDAMFRDTRGYIHYKLGNWKEALSDFQTALPAYAQVPEFHRRLAEVYGKLGMKEMSAEHSKRAEELAAKAKPTK